MIALQILLFKKIVPKRNPHIWYYSQLHNKIACRKQGRGAGAERRLFTHIHTLHDVSFLKLAKKFLDMHYVCIKKKKIELILCGTLNGGSWYYIRETGGVGI